jgi:hypothetical protein
MKMTLKFGCPSGIFLFCEVTPSSSHSGDSVSFSSPLFFLYYFIIIVFGLERHFKSLPVLLFFLNMHFNDSTRHFRDFVVHFLELVFGLILYSQQAKFAQGRNKVHNII